jgi:site-specific recombinase XerC
MGVRMGNWLSLKQAQALLNAPDIATTKGLRDRAIIAVLLGCGLRRSEVAAVWRRRRPAGGVVAGAVNGMPLALIRAGRQRRLRRLGPHG